MKVKVSIFWDKLYKNFRETDIVCLMSPKTGVKIYTYPISLNRLTRRIITYESSFPKEERECYYKYYFNILDIWKK